MSLDITTIAVSSGAGFGSALVIYFIGGFFSNREKRTDKLDNFKDQTIKDVAIVVTKMEGLSKDINKLEGKVEQNTEIIMEYVKIMDHVSRQLKRLFQHNGLKKEEKDE